MDDIRYAVVGLGWFAQEAILPAFEHAKHSRLAALVSGDATKLRELGDKYQVEHRASYQQYDELLARGVVDAVYIALPNTMHCEYTVRAAEAGVHVLCEKPMAMNEEECERMVAACHDADVRLMIAYRLHFEPANLSAIELARSGRLGEVRAFDAQFVMPIRDDNSRLESELGGGPLYDIGVYCINAARHMIDDEPDEVLAFTGTRPGDRRFREVEEQIGAVMRFPHGRIATFLANFGSAHRSRAEIFGTEGSLVLDPAFSHDKELRYELRLGDEVEKRRFKRRDQVAPEISHFSDCLLHKKQPSPSGEEGLADVRVIEALHESARNGEVVRIEAVDRPSRPRIEHARYVRPVRKVELFRARRPH